MKLKDLLANAPAFVLKRGSLDIPVERIEQDSRADVRGSVFVALKGEKFDGHDFLSDVVTGRPAALVVQDASKVPASFTGTVIESRDARQLLDFLSAGVAGHPDRAMICVGVTGTNGKTTTSHIVEHLLNEQGRKTGVIGTINHHLGAKIWPTALTTPGSLALYSRLSEFAAAGADALSIEVSSHALAQHRGEFIDFDAAVFMNLTRDHLDYHGTMDDYYSAKAKLFSELLPRSRKAKKIAVLNGDDPFGRRLRESVAVPALTFGQGDCDLRFEIHNEDFSGSKVSFHFREQVYSIQLPLPCRYNVYNSAAAFGAATGLGFDPARTALALETFPGVAGRLERVRHGRPFHVFVDYAHTDDALANVLDSLRTIRAKQQSKARIITVFGCGGDRDKGKRPLMAKAAVAGSDVVIVTSDNPRTEEPGSIINDILVGIPKELLGKSVLSEVQRRDAIEEALGIAQDGDVVLVAGKGHENYQVIGTQKIPFSDVDTVKELLT